MSVYLLDGKASHASIVKAKDTLKSLIPGLRQAASLDAIVRTAGAGEDPIIAIMVLPTETATEFGAILEVAAGLPRNIFLLVLGGEITAAQYKGLIRNRSADWIPMPINPAEVVEIVTRRRRQGNVPSARTSGTHVPVTISFVPSAGGVGTTTLAIEVAAYIKTGKAKQPRSVCLVDLDFQASHVCDYLDSEPRLQIAELCSAPERLDDQLFESFRTRHSSGIDAFAAPRQIVPGDGVNVDALDALLTMIARRYDVILLILPLYWFSWTPQVIAACDGAVIVGRNSVPGLRQVSEAIGRVRSTGAADLSVRIALNRCERTFFGSILNRKHAEKALREERIFFIGQRPEAIDSANLGVPMLLGPGARKVRREFAALGEFCATLEAIRSS